ncbi:hypothetical protein EGT47_27655 [Burkholderia cenocepacia]|uniref:hypothetical protein n=1 Tax=Burkholderia cenocepacia TaxID=95486 RepID=UPI000F65C9C1|nr:hypothetical protein [Burkholderia cenocepacia]RSB84873.1 hypothetical protein EGT47_27655 [Burkholderia cenocepacia]
MKKTSLIVATAAMLAWGNALAVENEAYVLADKPPIDGVIRQRDMIYALMLKDPCLLPIANAKNLRMAAIFNNRRHPERPDVGCWGKTLSPTKDEAIVIGPTGALSDTMTLTSFLRVSLDRNGDGKVLGAAMTYDQYHKSVDSYEKSLR